MFYDWNFYNKKIRSNGLIKKETPVLAQNINIWFYLLYGSSFLPHHCSALLVKIYAINS